MEEKWRFREVTRMDNVHAIKILKTEKSWESNKRISSAFDMGIKAIEALEKIKNIIREEEHYPVSNSLTDQQPNEQDYNKVHADKFKRIWKVISDAESNSIRI